MKKITLIMSLLALLTMSGYAATGDLAAVDQKTATKNVIMVIAAHKVDDGEYRDTRAELEKIGANIRVAAPKVADVKGMTGVKYHPDLAISDIDPKTADLIVVIGGYGALELWTNATLHEKIQAFKAQGKYVAAICAATGVLANAGVLDGIDATCFPSEQIIKLLKSKGANYRTDAVVTSGTVITGNGPAAGVLFGQKLASLLK